MSPLSRNFLIARILWRDTCFPRACRRSTLRAESSRISVTALPLPFARCVSARNHFNYRVLTALDQKTFHERSSFLSKLSRANHREVITRRVPLVTVRPFILFGYFKLYLFYSIYCCVDPCLTCAQFHQQIAEIIKEIDARASLVLITVIITRFLRSLQ